MFVITEHILKRPVYVVSDGLLLVIDIFRYHKMRGDETIKKL